MKYFSQYLAEFIGTFFMIFLGCGSMILSQVDPQYSAQFIPVIWGGVVSIMIYAVGHISGAHFNPAVTVAFFVSKKFDGQKLIGYLSAQFLGALLASFIHLFIWGSHHTFGMSLMNQTVVVGVVIEFIISFMLMFVITSVATDSRAVGELAGIAIGSTVALAAFVAGPLTGASMNPWRSLAPAILAGEFTHLWIYLLVPFLGTILGALSYKWISFCRDDSTEKKSGCC